MKKWKMVFFIIPAWILYSWFTGASSIINQINLYRANESLQNEIDSLTQVKTELDLERAKLQSDTVFLEKVVRSELGMAKPGEKVYRLFEAP